MPAAAVTPAPIVYLNVVAVKKLVVEFLGGPLRRKPGGPFIRLGTRMGIYLLAWGSCILL